MVLNSHISAGKKGADHLLDLQQFNLITTGLSLWSLIPSASLSTCLCLSLDAMLPRSLSLFD